MINRKKSLAQEISKKTRIPLRITDLILYYYNTHIKKAALPYSPTNEIHINYTSFDSSRREKKEYVGEIMRLRFYQSYGGSKFPKNNRGGPYQKINFLKIL